VYIIDIFFNIMGQNKIESKLFSTRVLQIQENVKQTNTSMVNWKRITWNIFLTILF